MFILSKVMWFLEEAREAGGRLSSLVEEVWLNILFLFKEEGAI